MHINEFDYHLPAQLIAQYPAQQRDQSRLLIVERKTNKITHSQFKAISSMFEPGDALVLNDTKVKPVRLIGKIREKEIDVLLVERLAKNKYLVFAKPGKKLKDKVIISFANAQYTAIVQDIEQARQQGMKCLEFQLDTDIETVLENFGMMPLPPYIKRKVSSADSARYQTVYAKNPGAIASPTAGLHFTPEILNQLREKKINTIYVTLHVGLGTFLPVKVDDIELHQMHKEAYQLTNASAQAIEAVKQAGHRICAVGTTACRVLESCADIDNGFSITAAEGTTEIFIYPPYKFKAVDMLLTNFHLPKTTLLMLISAFAGKELIMEAYRQAVEQEYRFFSYGDAMLII
ncbi:MAG: tRNA preQ1(34) S-adenosylmethionine ribosyltransferase-isomerase QueA [Candidatus Omnitrophica bacterium]|nr:tRNA preQ1(34) S-adenosylmethionine ribosyltransferase-isomerase QueA [Candidatus Omnitrophota bacterium]